MSQSILSYTNIRRLPSGRLLFVLRDILRVAEQERLGRLTAEVREAIAHTEKTLELELQWRTRKSNPSTRRGDAVLIDSRIDALLGGIEGIVRGHAIGDRRDPAVPAAQRFLASVFPLGLSGITHQPFEQQLGFMEAMQRRFSDELAEEVRTLGLRAKIEQLSELIDAFRVELEKTLQVLSWDTVTAAQNEGHERLAGVVVEILASHKARDAQTSARRAALLAEYDRQDRIVYEALRRRSRVLDIDPLSGVELAPPEESETLAEDAA